MADDFRLGAVSRASSRRVSFAAKFLDKSPQVSAARALYLKILVGGVTGLSIVVFGVFSIYWGSVRTTPHHTLPGWIVDFDGGAVGQAVSTSLSAMNAGTNGISWAVVSASQFSEGISQLRNAIVQEKTWYGVTINPGASANLSAAISAVDVSYDSSTAMTFLGSEARNEDIYRLAAEQLDALSFQFGLQFAKNMSLNSSLAANLTTIIATAPQLILRPIYYTSDNIRPFDVLVASAITFVGLIYLVILSFFIVLVSAGARAATGIENLLTLGSLIRVRLTTSFVAYFFISLFYTLLNRAFQLPFSRHFGHVGIVIFWMLNWSGMLAAGLALEAMVTLLTLRFIPFFLILLIISNVSVAVYPLQVLPHIYRYGYAFPFYNLSRAVRSIVFRTKNELGLNFGVLLSWVALSCCTLPLFQWFMRRRLIAAQRRAAIL
ncbi:hypothetical protein C8R46DRAFT_892399 [Mycena filopes]|nr:hypothetical protein C8R46DRAFT_892399 [Mycena filopes]